MVHCMLQLTSFKLWQVFHCDISFRHITVVAANCLLVAHLLARERLAILCWPLSSATHFPWGLQQTWICLLYHTIPSKLQTLQCGKIPWGFQRGIRNHTTFIAAQSTTLNVGWTCLACASSKRVQKTFAFCFLSYFYFLFKKLLQLFSPVSPIN